jgi:uncharacterized protein
MDIDGKVTAMTGAINLQIVDGQFGIARLATGVKIPDWLNGPGFSALIRASDELTVVCWQDRIPPDVTATRNWRCFRSVGPFAFDASGIVMSLIAPLSTQGIGVFVVCTFDGEHILVAEADWDKSMDLLDKAGHLFPA